MYLVENRNGLRLLSLPVIVAMFPKGPGPAPFTWFGGYAFSGLWGMRRDSENVAVEELAVVWNALYTELRIPADGSDGKMKQYRLGLRPSHDPGSP